MEENKIVKYEGGVIKRISNQIGVTNKLLAINLRQLNILHLDDHILYAKGVTKNCTNKKFPNAITEYAQNGDKAFEYVINCLENKDPLDLIITDFAHPGLNGIDFANAVRIKEIDYSKKIPILFLTLRDQKSLVQRIEEIPFVKFLSKTSPCEKINFAIESLI